MARCRSWSAAQKARVKACYEQTDWPIAQVAGLAGIPRTTLGYWIAHEGWRRPERPEEAAPADPGRADLNPAERLRLLNGRLLALVEFYVDEAAARMLRAADPAERERDMRMAMTAAKVVAALGAEMAKPGADAKEDDGAAHDPTPAGEARTAAAIHSEFAELVSGLFPSGDPGDHAPLAAPDPRMAGPAVDHPGP